MIDESVKSLRTLLEQGRTPRVVGIDDSPFHRGDGGTARVFGVVTSGTRFEGMLCDSVDVDGLNSTQVLAGMVCRSKFHAQIHAVLTDGITFGGLNVVDLRALHEGTQRPVIAVMRNKPDLRKFRRAIEKVSRPEQRWALVERAGPIHALHGFTFQCVGCEPPSAARALEQLTDRGRVPEPLRLAHLIGAAVVTGESGKRA